MAAITFNAAGSTDAIGQNGERSGIGPADEAAAVSARFVPLDPGVVSEAIPAFFIGRNQEGFWVARDAKGKIGGVFLLEKSALSFARRNSQPGGCATIYPAGRFELDLENKGNPFVAQLGSIIQFAMRHQQRMATFIGNATAAVKRRFEDFHVL